MNDGSLFDPRCPAGECDGYGWVEVGHRHTTPTVRSCSECRPDLHARWYGRNFTPRFASRDGAR